MGGVCFYVCSWIWQLKDVLTELLLWVYVCFYVHTCVCAPECLYVGDCVIFYMFVSTWRLHGAPAEFTCRFLACVCMLMHTLGIMILPERSHAVSHYALILSHGALQPSRVQCLLWGGGAAGKLLDLNRPIWLAALLRPAECDWPSRLYVVNLMFFFLQERERGDRERELDEWMRKGEISLGGLYQLWSLH